ncbi:hypothetical protein ACFPYJ_10180 [Paenibacillus solisilvae]|uniref:Uncharacterized protein n=1 Tax=Paenibacillus solisilvae TaxID=2486751 RepID=A0ABW0VVL3_9BACL
MADILTGFEKMIVSKLVEYHGCQPDEANAIVQKYLPVIRLLDDNHDSARIQAERYFSAYKQGTDPGQWVSKILQYREAFDIANEKLAGTHKSDTTSNLFANI